MHLYIERMWLYCKYRCIFIALQNIFKFVCDSFFLYWTALGVNYTNYHILQNTPCKIHSTIFKLILGVLMNTSTNTHFATASDLGGKSLFATYCVFCSHHKTTESRAYDILSTKQCTTINSVVVCLQMFSLYFFQNLR